MTMLPSCSSVLQPRSPNGAGARYAYVARASLKSQCRHRAEMQKKQAKR